VRARLAIASVVALAALIGIAAIVARWRASDDAPGLTFAVARPAAAPFAPFGETRLAVGSQCLRLLVASTEPQRNEGLRDVTALTPYDGMLFVFPNTTDARFTMANTPTPLDITWFDGHGTPVDHTTMKPCPNGTDETCPVYASKQRYRYALERFAGSGASAAGALGACA
jgi:uncharacterized membrane protein (UPF0127 family)